MDPLSLLRRHRRGLSIIGHMALVSFAYFMAYALRFDFQIPPEQVRRFGHTLPYLLLIRLGLFHRFGLFRGYWHLVGVRDLRQLVAAVTLGSVGFVALMVFLGKLGTMPLVVPMLDWLVTIMLAGRIRLLARRIRRRPVCPPRRGAHTLRRRRKEQTFRRRARRRPA